jgi:hypothetical protein
MSMVLSAQGAEEASVTPAQEQGSWWFELGMGEALLHSDSGSGSGSTLNLGLGYSNEPWGLGLEFGVVGNRDGCDLGACEKFAPAVSHDLVLAEYTVKNSAWRLRFGVGTFDYCTSAWLYACDSVTGPGVGLYATRHWHMTKRAVWSVGVRVGGELAHFSAKQSLDAPAFWHSAVSLSVQLRRR